MSNVRVNNLVLVGDYENILARFTELSGPHWFGHVVCMVDSRIPYRTLFSVPPLEWMT